MFFARSMGGIGVSALPCGKKIMFMIWGIRGCNVCRADFQCCNERFIYQFTVEPVRS